MKIKFGMKLITVSLSAFAIVGCGDKKKQEKISFNPEPLQNFVKDIKNAKIYCPSSSPNNCKIDLALADGTNIFSANLSLNDSNSNFFRVDTFNISGALFEKLILDSVQNLNSEQKDDILRSVKEFNSNILSNIFFSQDSNKDINFGFTDTLKAKNSIINFLTMMKKYDSSAGKIEIDNFIEKVRALQGNIDFNTIVPILPNNFKNGLQTELAKIKKLDLNILKDNTGIVFSYSNPIHGTCSLSLPSKEEKDELRAIVGYSYSADKNNASFKTLSGTVCN